ncbi:MAG: endonuclease V [Thermoplasmata archaeon]
MGCATTDLDDLDLYSYLYSLLKQIPEGCVTTYGDLASALGDPIAARAVGYMLSINEDPDTIPCYKVVRSDGMVGNYTHPLGQAEKLRRLVGDGISISSRKIDDFQRVRFTDFKTEYPLNSIRMEQERMREHIDLNDDYSDSIVSAVDVSYDDFNGYASIVTDDGNERTVDNFVSQSRFPYIPGYLSAKEFKFIKALYRRDSFLLVDGNGILHPRKMGLATYSGIKLDQASIGIAKSMFYDSTVPGYVKRNGEDLGYAVNRHMVISPGNRISMKSAVSEAMKIGGGKYPDILKAAHYSSVKLRKTYATDLK